MHQTVIISTFGDDAGARTRRCRKGVGVTSKELRTMLELFGQEQACYTALLDLSRRQERVIKANDLDALLQILSHKQHVLTKVGEVEQRLLPYKRNWDIIRATLDEDDRQVLDLALGTVEELLAELIAQERESERLLDQLRAKKPASRTRAA